MREANDLNIRETHSQVIQVAIPSNGIALFKNRISCDTQTIALLKMEFGAAAFFASAKQNLHELS
ncbi:hypothetical protein BZM26_31490 [Paraburkholderia strydomiana]|nr:hypothetical protein BZM26_31490 [Paraburkholderia strydomiana]